jgi:hypothetical protein
LNSIRMVPQALPEKDVLYQTDRKTFRDFLQRFEAGCMKRPRMKERLKTLKADIMKRVLLYYCLQSILA